MSRIHPTAQIDRGALLADDVEVGPWCLVGPGVELKAGVRLESNVVIVRDTVLGERTVVSPFAVLGGDPQHRG
ncbi:MAG TPA: acyl-[acyl-carrier-protein]--UDP-N-acetylglucosamine O-acyltransferase, partial [Caulobacteraceae bacterium]